MLNHYGKGGLGPCSTPPCKTTSLHKITIRYCIFRGQPHLSCSSNAFSVGQLNKIIHINKTILPATTREFDTDVQSDSVSEQVPNHERMSCMHTRTHANKNTQAPTYYSLMRIFVSSSKRFNEFRFNFFMSQILMIIAEGASDAIISRINFPL